MSTSIPPVPPTSGGNGKYVAAGVLLLLAGGGLIYMASGGSTQAPPPPPPPTTAARDAAAPPPAPTGPTVGVAFAIADEDAGPEAGPEEAGVDAGNRAPPQRRVVVREACPGVVDTAGVSAMLQASYGGLRECYNRALRTNPTLAGNVVASWYINANGTVGEIATGGAPSRDAEFRTCFQGAVRRLRFPPPRGGCAVFQQTFRFSAGP